MKKEFNEADLTAYLLGELDPDQEKRIAKVLENSPDLRRQIAEIERTVRFLEEEFAREEPLTLTGEQRSRVTEAAESSAPRRPVYRYSWWAAAAAACLLFAVVIRWDGPWFPVDPPIVPGYGETRETSSSGESRPDEIIPDDPSRGPADEPVKEISDSDATAPAEERDGEAAPMTEDKVVASSPPESTSEARTETSAVSSGTISGPQERPGKVREEVGAPLLPGGTTGDAAKGPGPSRSESYRSGPAILTEQRVQARGRSAEMAPTGIPALTRVPWASPPAADEIPLPPATRPDFNTEAYERIEENPFILVSQDPLSTFSIDVDTASYANVRRFLNDRMLPPRDAVRIEELVNYFSYDYAGPEGEHPFAVHLETAEAPWSPDHRLVRIGLKGKEVAALERPPANLVFLIDVSGSMQPANKLPLLKRSLKLLVERLKNEDRIAVVVYAGASGLVLPSTPCSDKETILQAMEELSAGGSTNGGAGIELAYQIALENQLGNGINRVILATDGDFNVGTTSQGELTRLIEEKAGSGVFLTVLGFGMGNYKDSTLEKLADCGNGHYAYIDSLSEARKVLVEQIGSTLVTIARDVKIQLEFNPAQVKAYRLIGYENRLLRHQDFNDDRKDAGEIGSGHTVTALYEIVPPGVEIDVPGVDPLKYQQNSPSSEVSGDLSGELLTVKLRYKQPHADQSRLLEVPLRAQTLPLQQASSDFRFAAAVASFGMLLRDSEFKGTADFDRVLTIAGDSLGEDREGYRKEFLKLVQKARALRDLEDLE